MCSCLSCAPFGSCKHFKHFRFHSFSAADIFFLSPCSYPCGLCKHSIILNYYSWYFFLQQKCLLLVFHFDNDFLEYRCDTFSATDISFLCCVPHGLCKRSFRNQFDYRNFFLQQKYPFWVVSPMDPANLHSEIDLKLFLQQKLSILCSIPHELCKLLFRIDLIVLILFVVAPVELFPDPAPE